MSCRLFGAKPLPEPLPPLPNSCEPVNSGFIIWSVANSRASTLLHHGRYVNDQIKMLLVIIQERLAHNDVIKWKHFPRYWPFARGIHRSPVTSPHKGQWCGALMFSLICVRISSWINSREAGDLKRYRAHYDVIVMHIYGRKCDIGAQCKRDEKCTNL